MIKGSISVTKDGGPHENNNKTSNNDKSNIFSSHNTLTAARNTTGHYNVPEQSNILFAKESLCVAPSPHTSVGNVNIVKKDNAGELISNQRFEWMKGDSNLEGVDILEMDAPIASSLAMGIESGSDLADHLADFVFTPSLSDSNCVKQEYSNYLEILESTDQVNNVNSFTEHNINWGTVPQFSQPDSNGMSIPQILVRPAHYSTEQLSVAPNTSKEEVDNNCSNVTIDSSESILQTFDTDRANQTSIDTLKVVQYSTPSSLLVQDPNPTPFCPDTPVSNIIINSPQDANLACLSQHKSDTGLTQFPSQSNVAEEVNGVSFSQLPNFLGLDAYISEKPATEDCETASSATAALNLLEPLVQSVSSANHLQQSNQITLNSVVNQDAINCVSPDNPNLNVTTISIPNINGEDGATKISVNTCDGQQMFIINAADLSQLQTLAGNSNVRRLYVINNSQEQDQTCSSADLVSTDPSICQSNSTATAEEFDSQPAVQDSSVLLPAELSGFVLMPLVENTTNNSSTSPLNPSNPLDPKKLPKKPLTCTEPGCGKTFKKASKLKVHRMMHTGERPFKCTWIGCEWAFTTSNKLKRHLESHEGRKDYVCDKPGCGHRFTTIYNLNTHRKLHERPCTEICPQDGCNQSFATKRQLDIHLRQVHAIEELTFKCPEPGCSKVFFSSGCMGSHMKVHRQNMDDLRCKEPGCGKQFTKMCRLRQHQQLHTGEKPFVCNYEGCTWAFATASKLKRHQTKHTGYRKWVCSICQKQFQRSEHLKGHLITHSGDRPFVCPVNGCGNTFTAKSSLYVHLKKHDESGKTIVYHCPMENCNNFYANKASLRQHILLKHCSLPSKNGANSSQVLSSWLSLLASGEESYIDDATAQPTAAASQDSLLAHDFLTGSTDVVEPTVLAYPTRDGDATSTAVISPGSMTLSSSAQTTVDVTVVTGQQQHQLSQPVQHQQLQQQPQHKQILLQGLQLMDEQELLQQQERMSHVAVERGRKSQIILENIHGSARTDPRSNDIVSLRALQRWQKKKEEEAAKLRARLDKQEEKPALLAPVPAQSETGAEYKSPVSNNVLLGARGHQQYFVVSKTAGLAGEPTVTSIKEISDLEMESEGITDMLDSDVGPDSFMTEFFVRDPESGITYRQAQLLQDDPPNHGLLEDIEAMDALDVHFVEDSLTFHPME